MKIPEIKLDDFIEIEHENEYIIYKLEDIACWEKDHSIKSIKMVEHRVIRYQYYTQKAFNTARKQLRYKAKLIFKNGDKLLIGCKHDSVLYTIELKTWNNEILQAYFYKMI